MGIRRYIIRNYAGPDLVELFLIGSVVSVLTIRAFLAATGYPQLGGDGLHIAHMLWGGLFMVGALLLLFGLLGSALQRWAAVLAGIGFGTFIDELGKFITSDHNYFFQPTIGLIYIIFIALFMLLRVLRRQQHLTPEEALANALHRLGGAPGSRVDAAARQELLTLLAAADAANPLTRTLQAQLGAGETPESSDAGFYFRLRDWFLRQYRRIAGHPWFSPAVLLTLALQALIQAGLVAAFLVNRYVGDPAGSVTFVAGAQLAAGTAAGALNLWGLIRLRRSRPNAYGWFLRAALVNIFVTQVFVFFEYQLAGLTGLFWNILLYLALRFMSDAEDNLVPPAVAAPTRNTGSCADDQSDDQPQRC